MNMLREYELRKELRAYYSENLGELFDIIDNNEELFYHLSFFNIDYFDEFVNDMGLSPIEVAEKTAKRFDVNNEWFKYDDETFISYSSMEARNILFSNLDRIINILLADENIQEKVNDYVKAILNKYKAIDKE